MGIFSFLNKNKKKDNQKTEITSQESAVFPDKLDDVLKEFSEQTVVPAITLKAVRRPGSVYESKFGGTPYLPEGFVYPYNESASSDRKPLKLLAQLNFTELPHLPGFPQQGILQFYVAYEEKDDVYGLDFDDPASQKSFRVIYHKEIVTDEMLLQQPPVLEQADNTYFPFQGEFSLIEEETTQPMSVNDFRFENMFMTVYKKHIPTEIKRSFELESKTYDKIFKSFSGTGHHIGGYPFFTQEDSRGYSERFQNHTVLLLQIDSADEIIWGDSGVANFFITPEDLKNCNFSNVLYTWDCY